MQRAGGSHPILTLILALAVFLPACGGSGDPVPDDVVRALDIPNNTMAIVGESMSEEVPQSEMLAAAARARDLGAELRFVVSGDDRELVNAKSVADRYGGIVLSYKTGSPSFLAGGNISDDQLGRAVQAAGVESDMGASAQAFVDVLEADGEIETRGRGLGGVPLWIWALLAVAIIFVLWQLRNYLAARRRAERRQAKFAERQALLADWAQRLAPEVETVRPHYSRLDATGRTMLDESGSFVNTVGSTIEGASSLAELDAAEIRIARTAIKLRTLRQTLGV